MKKLILSAIVACIAFPALAQVHRPEYVTPMPNFQQPVYRPPAPQPIYVPPPQYNAPPQMQLYQAPRQTVCQFVANVMICN